MIQNMIPKENKKKLMLDIEWDDTSVFRIHRKIEFSEIISSNPSKTYLELTQILRNFDIIPMYFLIKRPNHIARINFIIKIG